MKMPMRCDPGVSSIHLLKTLNLFGVTGVAKAHHVTVGFSSHSVANPPMKQVSRLWVKAGVPRENAHMKNT